MPPCGSTLGGGAGAAYDIVSGVFTLGGGVTCGVATLLKISASCLRADVCLSPNVVSGLVGVRLSREWMRSAVACVAASFDEIFGDDSVAGKNSMVLETHSLDILGI